MARIAAPKNFEAESLLIFGQRAARSLDYAPNAIAVMHGKPSMIFRVSPDGDTTTTSPSAVAASIPIPPGARETSMTPPVILSVSSRQFAPSLDLKIAEFARPARVQVRGLSCVIPR